jgi:hypothetical protein
MPGTSKNVSYGKCWTELVQLWVSLWDLASRYFLFEIWLILGLADDLCLSDETFNQQAVVPLVQRSLNSLSILFTVVSTGSRRSGPNCTAPTTTCHVAPCFRERFRRSYVSCVLQCNDYRKDFCNVNLFSWKSLSYLVFRNPLLQIVSNGWPRVNLFLCFCSFQEYSFTMLTLR